MVRALFHAIQLPQANPPWNSLHLKIYYPAASTGSQAERMTGTFLAERTRAPFGVLIFFNGINVNIESYHWLAIKLTEAGWVTVLYTHIAETLPGNIGISPGLDLTRIRPETYGHGPTCPAIAPILNLLAQTQQQETHPLYGALNLNHIVLGGHSAGGTVALQNAQHFPQVQSAFAYAGHTVASSLLGFPERTALPIGPKPVLLLQGDQDGVIAASRERYTTSGDDFDPVAHTFAQAVSPLPGSPSYHVILRGANHFSIAHPLDRSTARAFLDLPTTRPAAQIRAQIFRLILAFLGGQPLQGKHIVIRRK
ncbi:MAG: hypothetical protein Fur0016_02900 [Anaerolineales bacterium]